MDDKLGRRLQALVFKMTVNPIYESIELLLQGAELDELLDENDSEVDISV
jgi:hypothetical protein